MEFFNARNLQRASQPVSRRGLLQASAAAALAGVPLAGRAGSLASADMVNRGARVESRLVFYEDPLEHQRQSFRIQRNLYDEGDVLFWYHFTMFTVVSGRRPEAVVRWEGIELSHHRKLGEGVYRIHGHNLSFPRDLGSGRWTDHAVNPETGATVAVPPMALTGDPGYVYTPEGVVPLDNPEAAPRIRMEQFLVEDDLVKLEVVRQPPASWPATFIETSSNWSDRELFERDELLSLPTGTAGGYIFPWPAWLQMGDQPGHMFATWHGRKLASAAQLPAEFRARAAPEHEALLSVDTSVFDRPLPEPLKSRYGV
jgi:hypothetical protein